MKKLIISLMLIVIGFGTTILTYSAFSNDYLGDLSNIKIITFVFTALLVGISGHHLLKHRKSRYIFIVLLDIICTVFVILLNNFWHYEEFVSRFGNYGVTYNMFLINDINYSYGLGIFRYILFFALVLVTYFVLEFKFMEKIKRKTGSSSIKDTILKFVGLEETTYELVTKNEEINKLNEFIKNGNCEIYKSEECGTTVYLVEMEN